MDTDGSPTDEMSPPASALQWARVHQLLKTHGLTGVILILLAYQMGLLGQAQTGVCGL